MAAPIPQTFTNMGKTTSTTTTQTKPSGTVDGDLLIAYFFINGSDTNSTVPSGWTLLRHTDGTGGDLFSYYKIASSEGASWNWTWSGTNGKFGGCLRIDGQHASAFLNADNGDIEDDTQTPVLTCGIQTTQKDCLLVAIVGQQQNNSANFGAISIANNNPSWTDQAESNDGTDQVYTRMMTGTYAVPGDTGDLTMDNTFGAATADTVAQLIAIRPVSSGVTYESTTESGWATSDTFVAPKPTGLAVGDGLIAHVWFTTGGIDIHAPAGWTTLGFSTIQTGGGAGFIFGKVADSSDVAASDFTFTFDAPEKGNVELTRVSGNSTTIADWQWGGNDKFVNNTATPSINAALTPDTADSLLMQFWNGRNSVSSIGSYAIATDDPSWVEAYDTDDSPVCISLAYAYRPETTSTGNVSAAGGDATTDWAVGFLSIPANNIPYVASTEENSVIDNTITIDKPAGLAVGDLLFAQLGVNDLNPSFNTPGGWSVGLASNQNSSDNYATFYKVADASDVSATDFTFTHNGGAANALRGIILRIVGANTTTPVTATNQATVTGANPSFSNGITPLANSLLIMSITGDGNDPDTSDFAIANDDPSWVSVYLDSITYLITGARAAAGATGNTSLTTGGSQKYTCGLTAIAPADADVDNGNAMFMGANF